MSWKKGLALCLAVVMLFSLVACQKKPVRDTSPELNFETDSQYWLADGGFNFVAESETGFYYFAEEFLYYADKETMEAIPLCNKPNCLIHEKPDDFSVEEMGNCGAYLAEAYGEVLYYDGYLYVIMDNSTLVESDVIHSYALTRISLDGTERKPIWTIDPGVPVEFGSIWDFALHRGDFYFTVENVLYAYNLKSKKVTELRKFETLPSIFAMGDHLFVDSEGNMISEGKFRYTISTGEWEEYSGAYAEILPHHGGVYFYCIEETPVEKLWGVETDRMGENERVIEYESNIIPCGVSEKYLCARDMGRMRMIETGEFISLQEYYDMSEEYGQDVWGILVDTVQDDTYEIYDRETMEVLGQLPVLLGTQKMWFTEERLYAYNSGDEYGNELLFYADLSDLGSDAFGWKQVEIIK